MVRRKFDNEKLQEIYNTEFAKEIAKVDAQNKETNSIGYLIFLAFIFVSGYYLYKLIF
jgi:hypothetical protein